MSLTPCSWQSLEDKLRRRQRSSSLELSRIACNLVSATSQHNTLPPIRTGLLAAEHSAATPPLRTAAEYLKVKDTGDLSVDAEPLTPTSSLQRDLRPRASPSTRIQILPYQSCQRSCLLHLGAPYQNKAMEVTISKEYLNSVHQWCKWYILKKPKKTLGPLYTKKNEFRSKLLKVVSHMLKVDKFEAACDMLLDKNTI